MFFKWRHDRRSGNCILSNFKFKKNFGTSTGFEPMASALALQPEIVFGLICHCLNCNYHCQDHIFIKKFVFPQFISSSYDRSRADIFWKINGCWCWTKPTSIFLEGLLVGLGWQLRQLGRTDTYRQQTLKKTEEKTKQNKTKWLFSTGMIKIFIIDIITPV